MVKYKIKWSIEARLDLIDILEFYLTRNGNTTYSRKLNLIIKRGTLQISKNPHIGIQTDFDSVRALITSDYQIIYEIIENVILIVMIWDCRRDPV
jgi:toxin YoeB